MTRDNDYNRSCGETIGQRLREVRAGMSQAEFAQQLTVSQSSIANYETDKRIPDAAFILELMSIFDVDPVWLISGKHRNPASGNFSNEERQLIESYRKSGEQKKLIQSVANAFASLAKGE